MHRTKQISFLFITFLIFQILNPGVCAHPVGDSTIIPENNIILTAADSASSDTLEKLTEDQIFKKEPVPDKKFEMQKSPLGAAIRSLIFPGWGQLYVDSYWKAPIFLGATATLVYLIAWNHNKYIDAKKEYCQKICCEFKSQSDPVVINLYNKKEFYRDNRDMSAFYTLGVYILGAVDAYVGAHLYDFSVSDDLSLLITPGKTGGVQLNIFYNW